MENLHPTEKLLSDLKTGYNITGCLSPFKENGQPWLVQLPGNPSYWVAVYTTEEKLRAGCVDLNIQNYRIKEVTDGVDFLDSICSAGIRVMLNPYSIRSENKTRWTEILPAEQENVSLRSSD